MPTPEPEQVLVNGTGSPSVNMRREPGTTAPVVKSVADGTLVTVVGTDREAEGRIWRNVQDGDTTGWIVGSALRPVPTPTTTPSATPTPGPTATAVEARAVTSTNAPPATPAPPEPTSVPEPEQSDEPTPEPERVEVFGTDPQGANLRAQPGRRGAVIRSVPDGSHLTVIGEDQEADGATWRNVQADDGTTGWLSTEVIRTIVTPTPTPRPGAPGIGAPIPVEDQPESELTEEQRAATPCRPGQLKGDAATGIYYPPVDPAYPELRQRVRCFDDASRARASGFRPPEASPEPSPSGE